jgi:hypothetical protein
MKWWRTGGVVGRCQPKIDRLRALFPRRYLASLPIV